MNVMEKDRSVHAVLTVGSLTCHQPNQTNIDGGRGSLVSASSELKPEDPGFDPLAEQGDTQFVSVPPNQLLCRLVCA